MIEIVLIVSVKPESTQPIELYQQVLKNHLKDWHKFFKKYVEQNTILNYFCFYGISTKLKTMESSYFSDSADNAQILIDAILDTTAEFSPARLSDEYGFQLVANQREVADVNIISKVLFNSNDVIWSGPDQWSGLNE